MTTQPLVTGSGLDRLRPGVERPVVRPGWSFIIQGGSDFTYTDNARLTGTDREADFVTTPKAIFQARDVSTRTAISARAEFDYDFYSKNSDLDGFRPTALILGRSDVVEDELSIDARFATNLQQISSQDRTPATDRGIGENQVQIVNYGLRPTWTEHLNSDVQSEVYYDVSAVGFAGRGSVLASDTVRHVGHANLSNGTAFDRFGWSVTAQYDAYAGSHRSLVESFEQYRVSNTFALTGHVGHDWFGDSTIKGTPNGPFALAGFSWNPASRVSVHAEAGYRYQDFNANANISVTLARALTLSASYISDYQNSQVALINSLADLARDPFGNLLLNGTTGLPYVTSGLFDDNGVPLPDPNSSPFTFTNTTFKRDLSQAGIWGTIGRNSYNITASYEKRVAAVGKADSWGGSASLSRELNRRLRVSVEARYDRVKGTEEVFSLAALDSKTLSGKVEARYRLGPTVNASLRYVYLQRTTTRVDYRENVGMLGLTKTF
ncbi:MAG: TIGR03016 family PEP-CTERM system-associated outer membrane protein [Rhodospirillaceae bacterium]